MYRQCFTSKNTNGTNCDKNYQVKQRTAATAASASTAAASASTAAAADASTAAAASGLRPQIASL